VLAINDLSHKLKSRRAEILAAIARVVDRGWLVLGPEVRAFETAFASYLGVSFCVGVGNGTDALEIGLKALGVKPGDRVLTVANAGNYGATAIRALGAQPQFLDVDAEMQHATLEGIATGIDAGANAVVLTHLFGRAVGETEAIAALCAARNVSLLEDCAQAHGAALRGRKIGTFGGAAAFSFYPTKNLGALGDGGAIVTNEREVAERASMLRQYGWKEKYRTDLGGGRNSRLDEIHAAVLGVLLGDLDVQNDRRRSIGARYDREIRHPKIRVPNRGGADDVVHLYVVRSSDRDGLKAWLGAHEIGSDVHYPVPDHRQSLVTSTATATAPLPVTEQLANEILTLPCYPELKDTEVDNVIRVINNWPQ
jgi:dTDP-3-amino-2,3,6-trideoxy-4-keto-D-glucose/dTDP-3-amino-3,4,6-trideoxy-alpha-D-glucose/dTDP-2,6-dideoxy-D-kanosamine transaminase